MYRAFIKDDRRSRWQTEAHRYAKETGMKRLQELVVVRKQRHQDLQFIQQLPSPPCIPRSDVATDGTPCEGLSSSVHEWARSCGSPPRPTSYMAAAQEAACAVVPSAASAKKPGQPDNTHPPSAASPPCSHHAEVQSGSVQCTSAAANAAPSAARSSRVVEESHVCEMFRPATPQEAKARAGASSTSQGPRTIRNTAFSSTTSRLNCTTTPGHACSHRQSAQAVHEIQRWLWHAGGLYSFGPSWLKGVQMGNEASHAMRTGKHDIYRAWHDEPTARELAAEIDEEQRAELDARQKAANVEENQSKRSRCALETTCAGL